MINVWLDTILWQSYLVEDHNNHICWRRKWNRQSDMVIFVLIFIASELEVTNEGKLNYGLAKWKGTAS